MKVSIPFGYYRGQVSPKTTRPAVVEFIDADALVISGNDAAVAAEWKPRLRFHDDWDAVTCRCLQGDFLVPLGNGPETAVMVDDLPTPLNKKSGRASVLMGLMPMNTGEPIHKACMEALATGEDRWSGLDVSEAEYDRNARIQYAMRVATSLVVIDGAVWRKVPEPKLKMEISGGFARLGVYFGGIHWSEKGRHTRRGEYVLPLTASDDVRELLEFHGLQLAAGEIVKRVHLPALFTFRASASLAEVLSRWMVGELREYVGSLDHEQIVRWVDLREMSERVGKVDKSFGHDFRGDFRHQEMLDNVDHLAGCVRDAAARRQIEMLVNWAQTLEEKTADSTVPLQRPMGGPRAN
jgi:hypothetical protein